MRKINAAFLTTIVGICTITCNCSKGYIESYNDASKAIRNENVYRKKMDFPVSKDEEILFKKTPCLNNENDSYYSWDNSVKSTGQNIFNKFCSDYYYFSIVNKTNIQIEIDENKTKSTNFSFYLYKNCFSVSNEDYKLSSNIRSCTDGDTFTGYYKYTETLFPGAYSDIDIPKFNKGTLVFKEKIV